MWIGFVDARLDWSKAKAAEFNAMFPQYEVTVEGYSSYEDILKATDAAIQQGNPPAINHFFEVGTQRARDLGYFKPIAEALGDKKELNGIPVDLEDYIPQVVAYYTLDGKFTSMPWNTSSAIMYANAEMLAAAGVDAVPATWGELEAACEKIMAKQAELRVDGCITWPNHGWFFEQWMAQHDAPLVNNDNGRSARATEVLLDSEAAITIASWWQKLYNQKYYIYTGKQRDWDGTQLAFQTGKVALYIASSADAANITNAAKQNSITVQAAKMPYNEKAGYTGNLIGGGTLWLVNGLDVAAEEGALTFLLWFTNARNIAEWHQVTGYVPLRTSSIKLLEEQGWFKANPNFTVASDQLNGSKVTTATRGALFGSFPETRDIITQTLEDLMLKGGDVVAAMKTAKQAADKALADYNALYVR